MISLVEYILEGISSNELLKDITFKKVSEKDNEKIVKDNLKRLDIDNYEDIMLDIMDNYQIIYKGKCLGVFALYNFDEIKDRHTFKEKFPPSHPGDNNRFGQMRWEFIELSEIFSTWDAFTSHSIYVGVLLLLPDVIKELDINPIATIKTFFAKLKEYCKSINKDVILAHGKDDRVSRLYCKCGGFKTYYDAGVDKKFIEDNKDKFKEEIEERIKQLKHTLYYKIK